MPMQEQSPWRDERSLGIFHKRQPPLFFLGYLIPLTSLLADRYEYIPSITFRCDHGCHGGEKRFPEAEVIVNAVSMCVPHKIHDLSEKTCQLGALPAKFSLQFRHSVGVAEEGRDIVTAAGQFFGR